METQSIAGADFLATLPPGAKLSLVVEIPITHAMAESFVGTVGSLNSAGASAETAVTPTDPKRDRLVIALNKVEPNDTRKIIIDLLKSTAEDEWLPFPTMVAAIEVAGAAKGKAAYERGKAALRDLSWQLKAHIHEKSDFADCVSPIDLLATRRRFGTETRYRLTPLGRAALAQVAWASTPAK